MKLNFKRIVQKDYSNLDSEMACLLYVRYNIKNPLIIRENVKFPFSIDN